MKFDDDHEQLLTKIEAARLLNVSTRTLEIWARRKIIGPIRFGRTVRYRRDELLSHASASTNGRNRTAEPKTDKETERPLADLAKKVRGRKEAA